MPIETKNLQAKPQFVAYSGWTLDTYEISKDKKELCLTNNEYHFAGLNSNGKYVANLKSYIRALYGADKKSCIADFSVLYTTI